MVNNEGNWILQIIISYEEKHRVYDEISLSSDDNNRARPPRRCGVYLLANNTLKPAGFGWEVKSESLVVSQVSVIADIEQL